MFIMESTINEGKELLTAASQTEILNEWPKRTQEEQAKMAQQVIELNKNYPGGILEYIKRAKALLADAKEGANPYDAFTPSVPSGEKLSFDDPSYEKLEDEGLVVAQYTGFVLVAGGLGERLGYSSIKIGIPMTAVLPDLTFIKFYIESLKALEDRIKPTLPKEEQDKFYVPLCIMTSGDTDKPTREILELNNYYGKPKDQVTIVKQEKVPALMDINGTFAFDSKAFEIITKPHGHGNFKFEGRKMSTWLAFFPSIFSFTWKKSISL